MISGHFGKEKKMNYKMILQYDGTRYNGWQKQGNTDNTIQGKLETLLSRIAGEPMPASMRRDRLQMQSSIPIYPMKNFCRQSIIICRKTSKSPASRGCRSASTAV